MNAVRRVGMEEVMVRIYRAWPGSVDAQESNGTTAIMFATCNDCIANLQVLATFGTDLSITTNGGSNLFVGAENSNQPPEKKAAIFKALAEHGVTSCDIPARFQSPLYFKSVYYENNVRTQRWMNRKILMLCLSRVYGWSLLNQIEDEEYRTLPDDLAGIGRFVAHCWFDVAGGVNKVDDDKPDNGIARLVMSFAFGFNDSKSRASFALIGMPACGKVPETRARCSKCNQHSKKELMQCCNDTRIAARLVRKLTGRNTRKFVRRRLLSRREQRWQWESRFIES
jgi:hypothetical protein